MITQGQAILPETFFCWKKQRRVVDVRSAGAFAKGSLKGAVSHPFDSADSLHEFAQRLINTYPGEDFHLIDHKGEVGPALAHEIPLAFLEGGYQNFRVWRENVFSRPVFIILGGLTGSGKTELLEKMENKGFQVLNLERLARHRGSVFGAMEGEQPKHEDFQNTLLSLCLKTDGDRPVWMEEKGDYLGRAGLPESFKKQMKEAVRVQIEKPFDERLKTILQRYAGIPNKTFTQAIRRIEKRMGTSENHKALHYYENGEHNKCFRLLLNYYDRAYASRKQASTPARLYQIKVGDLEINDLRAIEREVMAVAIKREGPKP
jgi:hypothetical protein